MSVSTLERPTDPTPEATAAAQPFVISWLLDAPVEQVWKAHSEVELLRQWWGPKGMVVPHASLNFRTGGSFHYSLALPGSEPVMWGKFRYLELQAPERIDYISTFSDPEGAIQPAPFPGAWPVEIQNTMTLAQVESKTLLTQTATPLNASEAECRFFGTMFGSLREGYSGTFEKLEAFLVQQRSA